jgi:hypothetical protein
MDELDALLRETVEMRLLSEVRVSAFLRGGIFRGAGACAPCRSPHPDLGRLGSVTAGSSRDRGGFTGLGGVAVPVGAGDSAPSRSAFGAWRRARSVMRSGQARGPFGVKPALQIDLETQRQGTADDVTDHTRPVDPMEVGCMLGLPGTPPGDAVTGYATGRRSCSGRRRAPRLQRRGNPTAAMPGRGAPRGRPTMPRSLHDFVCKGRSDSRLTALRGTV